jgi:hypothetical protein
VGQVIGDSYRGGIDEGERHGSFGGRQKGWLGGLNSDHIVERAQDGDCLCGQREVTSDMHRGEREHIFASHIPSNAKSLSVLPLLLDGEMVSHTDPREAFSICIPLLESGLLFNCQPSLMYPTSIYSIQKCKCF